MKLIQQLNTVARFCLSEIEAKILLLKREEIPLEIRKQISEDIIHSLSRFEDSFSQEDAECLELVIPYSNVGISMMSVQSKFYEALHHLKEGESHANT